MPTTKTKDNVGNNAAIDTSHAPKNLANTTCPSVKGRVNKSSKVPVRCSSANDRMVMAGIRNISTQGAMANNGANEAIPVQDVPTPWEQPQEEPTHQQKHGNHRVANQRAEETLDFS